jgi:putative protease
MDPKKEVEAKKEVGTVTHYFPKLSVVIVELKAALAVGDKISILGKTTRLEQVVESMQIEHKGVKSASRGQSIGLRVTERAREGDVVYK